MNLLLTNDDGIDGQGLLVLASVLSKKHNVFVVAPKKNKSGASCQMNVAVPLELKKVEMQGCKVAFYLDGSPVDCVLSGLNGDYIGEKIDAVISGINDGPNIGTDIVYSGTCGGARQASLTGIPGIALSIDFTSRDANEYTENFYFENIAEFTLNNLEKLISFCGQQIKLNENHKFLEYFVNVNAPAMKTIKGAKITEPCKRRYWETVLIEQKNGITTSKCGGDYKVFSFGPENIDSLACESGYISVSVVKSEPTKCEIDFLNSDFVV